MTLDMISQQLRHTVSDTEFPELGKKYSGKVRDSYIRGDIRFLVTTDKLSCFDRILTTIPFKGQVLNRIAGFWLQKAKSIVPVHLIDTPDPQIMVCHQCEVIPVEVVVRNCLAGSLWRAYAQGERPGGVQLPDGLTQFCTLPSPIITPTTKAEIGDHDTPVSEVELLSAGAVSKQLWDEIKEVALALFDLGLHHAEDQGLILADTKYEFGLYKGKLMLVDEIHTLDSSRYWTRESWESIKNEEDVPEMLDKEPARKWLASKGFMGDGPLPKIEDSWRFQMSKHYIDSVPRVLGTQYTPIEGDALLRMQKVVSAL